MLYGKTLWWSRWGYGKIVATDGTEYFAHHTALSAAFGSAGRRSIQKDSLVSFEVGVFRGESVARDIALIEAAPEKSGGGNERD